MRRQNKSEPNFKQDMLAEQNDHPEKKNNDLNAELQNEAQQNLQSSGIANTSASTSKTMELKALQKSVPEANRSIFNLENHLNRNTTDEILIPINSVPFTSNALFDASFFEHHSTGILHAIVNMKADQNENEFIYKPEFDYELHSEPYDLSTTEVDLIELDEVCLEEEIPTGLLEKYEEEGWSLLKDHAYGLWI